MTFRILRRRILDEDNKRLPPIKRQLTSAPLSLPNAKGNASERVASASAAAGAAPTTPITRTTEGGKPEAKKVNTEVQDREAKVRSREEDAGKKDVVRHLEKAHLSSGHFEASIRHAQGSSKTPEQPLIIPETSFQWDRQSGISQHQIEPRTNRAAPEIQEIEKQLREKERHLQIREAGVQDVEKVLRVKDRDLQIREAEVQDVEKVLRMKERDLQIREEEVQKILQAVNERREAMDLRQDNPRQRLAAMTESEDPSLRQPSHREGPGARAQQMTIAWQPNGTARESGLSSLSSNSTIRNTPYIHRNVDLSPESNAKVKRDSGYHGNELSSLASTTRSGPSRHTDIYLSSSKSLARLKEDSEYCGNE